MRQQINLYQTAAHPRNTVFAATDAALALVVIIGALLSIWGYGQWQIAKLARSAELVQQRQAAQQEAMQAALQSAATAESQTDIEAKNKKLTTELDNRKKALTALRAGAVGNTTGFAARLEALARQHVEGVRLGQVLLKGDAMSLSGETLEAQLVPAYLKNLATDSALAGARFDQFVLERGKDNEGQVSSGKTIRFRAMSSSITAAAPEKSS